MYACFLHVCAQGIAYSETREKYLIVSLNEQTSLFSAEGEVKMYRIYRQT